MIYKKASVSTIDLSINTYLTMLDLKLFAIHTKSYLEKLFAIFIIFYEEDDMYV